LVGSREGTLEATTEVGPVVSVDDDDDDGDVEVDIRFAG
jgi:hypothetical protein